MQIFFSTHSADVVDSPSKNLYKNSNDGSLSNTEKEENTQQDTGSGSNLRTTYVMLKSFRPKPVGIYPTSPGFTPFLSRKLQAYFLIIYNSNRY